MGPLTLNWFEVTVVNNTPGVHCVTRRDSLDFTISHCGKEEKGREGRGIAREGEGGRITWHFP